MAIVDEPLDLVLDEAEGHSPGPLGLEPELEGELTAEIGGVDQRVVQVQSADLVGMEVISQPPESRGLAAARLAGEQSDGFGVDEIAQAGVELFEAWAAKGLIGGEGSLEGGM